MVTQLSNGRAEVWLELYAEKRAGETRTFCVETLSGEKDGKSK